MTELRLTLPDALAKEVQKAGLLESRQIEAILREELRRRSANELLGTLDRLHEVSGQPMTPDEIQAEINEVRHQRRNGH